MKISLLKNHETPAFLGAQFNYSYTDFLAFVYALSGRMPKGLNKAAIFAENSPEWISAFYGVWNAGACAVPIDARSSASEVNYILNDCYPEVVFTDKTHFETLETAVSGLAKKPQIFMLEGICEASDAPVPSGFEVLRAEEDLALIIYTSGTTGNPKGVMLTFRNLEVNISSIAGDDGYYYEFMKVLAMLPFHHVLPLVGTVLGPVYVGGSLIFPKSLSPADISEILKQYPATMIVGVPRFYELIHANIKEKLNRSKILKLLFNFAKLVNSPKLSRVIFGAVHRRFGGKVETWVCGGAALQKEVWNDMKALGFNLCIGYGMTECAPMITFPRKGRVKVGSSGQPLECMEVRIVDGEIVVRGENVTQGYFNKPEETALSIRNGWLYTGDIGYFDEENYIFITGRRKEIIVLANGKNIDPFEIECRIKDTSEDVLEVGVVMYEDILQAIIRLKEHVMALPPEALQRHVRDNIILPYNRVAASYKRIIRFVCTSKELPRTRVGKLKRFHLPAYLESIKADIESIPLKPEPDSEVYAELKSLISSQISMPVMPDAHIEMDLGLDSLGKISLQCHIKENYGVELSERDFEKYSTIRTLAEHVESKRGELGEAEAKTVTWTEIIKTHTNVKLPKTNFFHFVSIIFFRTFVRLFYKVRIEGFENIPVSGAFMITPNHQSYLDGVFAVLPFSKTKLYDTYFFAKVRSIIKSGFIRYYARRSNVVIMDITDNVRESLQKLAQVLGKGSCVVIFPEGTRTRDGEIAEFRQSFAILSKELNVPVIPTLISGAYEALKSRSSLPKYGASICVKYLPLMLPKEGDTYESFSSDVRRAVEDALKQEKSK